MASKTYSAVFTTGNPASTTGLSPTFLVFKRLDTDANLTPPAIAEVATASGIYKFSYEPTLPIAFVLDGGVSAGTSRYLPGNLDPIQLVDYQAMTLTAIGTSGIALGTTNVALGTTGVALGITNVALGTSNFALGTTGVALGTTAVAIGTTLTGYGVSIYAGTQTLLAFGSTGNALGLSILAILGTTASSYGTTSTDPVDIFGMLKRAQEFMEGNASFTKTSGLWEIKTRGSTLFATKTLDNTVTTVTKS
jgi:hypothetical protein